MRNPNEVQGPKTQSTVRRTRSVLDGGPPPLSVRRARPARSQSAVKPAHSKTWRLIAAILFLVVATLPCGAQSYSIDWHSIDGGGGTSSGGTYTLSGTIGQPDAGTLSGGSYTLEGGFWPGIIVPSTGELPALFIQLSGANVIISWAPGTSGFILEQTDNLSLPLWSPGPNGNPTPPVLSSTGTKFYRLRKP